MPLPLGVACLRGAKYTKERPPKVGDQVMMQSSDATKYGLPSRQSPFTVRNITQNEWVTLCGPDGKELEPLPLSIGLAKAKEAGWILLHYAATLECGEEVMSRVLDAHIEVSACDAMPMMRM